MMNIAFPALIIFIFTLPGIVLRYSYRKGSWNSPYTIGPPMEELFLSLILAIFLHTAGFLFLSFILHHKIKFHIFYALLSGNFGENNSNYKEYLDAVNASMTGVISYFSILMALSSFLGYYAHKGVRALQLDRKHRLFRFKNEWHYIFTGEIAQFGEIKLDPPVTNPKLPDVVMISAVVPINDTDYIFRGILADFYFNKQGDLDRIILQLAHRRKLIDDPQNPFEGEQDDIFRKTDPRFYNISGNLFIIKYSNIKTLSIEYLALEKIKTP